MDHIPNRPMDGRSIVARENVSSLSNVQTSHCEWCRRFSSCAGISCSSRADWYINPELNASAGLDSGTGGATLETHVGYDFDNGAYIKQDQQLSCLTLAKTKSS